MFSRILTFKSGEVQSTEISDFINKKYDNNDNSEVIDKGQDNIPDIDIDSDKPTVTLDACDVNTVAKANSVANISKDGKYNYFGYTDSEGRLYKTTADVLRHKSDTGRGTGQMCDSRYPSNSNDKAKKSIGFVTSGGDDRGHAIGDQFDLINNMDRDEVFKGMLEEVNTWDIRSDKQECTNMMTQIIEIIDTL